MVNKIIDGGGKEGISGGIFSMLHNSYIHPVNNSKLFAGILMILMNVGSRYIEMGFTKSQENILKAGLGREIVIFCVVFLGTRDLVMSILMTAAFIILSEHLFNEKSQFCIMPNKLKHIASVIDMNGDDIITASEERKAIEILEKAKVMRKKQQQAGFLSYMNSYSGQDLTHDSNLLNNESNTSSSTTMSDINEGFTEFY
jgi:hypothetical protein